MIKHKEDKGFDVVGYQGAPGSYSSIATCEYFGYSKKTQAYREFEDVILALNMNEIRYGVLPIENSSTGTINDVYELLMHYCISIVGEKIVPIQFHLLGIHGVRLENIKTIVSHVQTIKQCNVFLRKYPNIKVIEVSNTMHVAEQICKAKDVSTGVIASKFVAGLYGLSIISSNIQNNKNNNTRFVVVSKTREDVEGDKVSVAFTLPNESGALFSVLSVLKDNDINITKIESRPYYGDLYRNQGNNTQINNIFYLDFQAKSLSMVDDLKSRCSAFYLLGMYKSQKENTIASNR